VDLSFAVPHNRVRGIREWNQGGADLSDLDGFASWDVEFFAGATSLATVNQMMGNGGAPFTTLLPGTQELNGVTRVRLSNMRKLNAGATAAPLVREVQLMQLEPAWPCRRSNGTVEWYNAGGDPIPAADVGRPTYALPSWFSNMNVSAPAVGNPGWTESTDSGVSYHAMPNLPTPQYTGPTGTQRFRQTFTVPSADAENTLVVRVSGDIHSGLDLVPAHVYVDGVDQGAVTPVGTGSSGPKDFVLGPLTAGAHTFELWIGGATNGGQTNPSIVMQSLYGQPLC
jgi:hypothetical protein